jgi:hypothetical protein
MGKSTYIIKFDDKGIDLSESQHQNSAISTSVLPFLCFIFLKNLQNRWLKMIEV